MNYGFSRVSAISIDLQVGNCKHNVEKIIESCNTLAKENVEIAVFQELAITGYTCSDLFNQQLLIDETLIGINEIIEKTLNLNMLIIVGAPIVYKSKLYNCALAINNGKILAIIPKTHLPNYSEFYEKRHFAKPNFEVEEINILGQKTLIGSKILLINENNPNVVVGIEICEDLWATIPPSSYHTLAGATIIANLSASNESAGKTEYRENLVLSQSSRNLGGYIYASAGQGESTTDLVYCGRHIIAQNGNLLAKNESYNNTHIIGDIDVSFLNSERRRITTFENTDIGYKTIFFSTDNKEINPIINVSKYPFIPHDESKRDVRCEEILTIQALGLKKRLEHTRLKKAVIGVSGGLDSTLALLVIYKAFDMLALDKKGIITVTMPCFGTTNKTYNNAVNLSKLLDVTLLEVNIKEAVLKHFSDIGHDKDNHDLTYENSQARERTQILMDIASKENCFVVGTGDLSELALGFATYNGDHMSMYGVNSSIPKTLIRYLIKYEADRVGNLGLNECKNILYDILETPVSPELLPPVNGIISQITEEIVGPYELHDFFLYHMMRNGFTPDKVYYFAKCAFKDVYDNKTILKWLKMFYSRFFTQQFKRSCMPDGPKVGSVTLSPRGDWRMPSDASYRIWIDVIDKL